MNHLRALKISIERWPIAGVFTIARGAKTEALAIVVTISQNGAMGAGECAPYARYGESAESVAAQIESAREKIELGASRADLQDLLPAGAARNALDCALWALESAQTGRPVHDLAGLPAPRPMTTAYTLSLGAPEEMAAAARKASAYPLLKVKLGGEGDVERIKAVRAGAPNARLIVDANEAWRPENLRANILACAAVGVELIEQPLPAGDDGALSGVDADIAICADESIHDAAGLRRLPPYYQAINVKLDKTGGLTDAIALRQAALQRGLKLMVGCMVGTSLAMRPALTLAAQADYVDLDGPLLLAQDREPALRYEGGTVYP